VKITFLDLFLIMHEGRPTIYSQELADKLCCQLAEGRSMRSICRQAEMPGQTTIYRWLSDNEGFREQYAKARELQADTLFDEIIDIADDSTNDWMERDGGLEVNGEHIQRTRLRIDTRKWMAGKLRPKKYGERIEHEHNVGSDLAALIAARRARVAELDGDGNQG